MFSRRSRGQAGATPSTTNCALGTSRPTDSLQPGFVGWVGEVHAYNGVITDAQRQFVECQRGTKWGIQLDGCNFATGRPTNTY